MGDQKLGISALKPLQKYENAIVDFQKHSGSKYHAVAMTKSEHFCRIMKEKIPVFKYIFHYNNSNLINNLIL